MIRWVLSLPRAVWHLFIRCEDCVNDGIPTVLSTPAVCKWKTIIFIAQRSGNTRQLARVDKARGKIALALRALMSYLLGNNSANRRL